ncbi:hypothetical protein KFL_008620055 [Klebsormidium nitens]|uniref:Uncharacterized protein n=1 Tax=Klebsormidium nitens TaxID=105231 RepID=A0A1Y1IRF8_KLENI|nr:hypothetical protein KFL_008620055 [Klebsormidium nitens]|eukprot:GAQ91821.1 hypothetical protein KFL_008620055 [Klebsormidium nitens]
MKRLWRRLKGGDGSKNGDRAPVRAALAEAPGGRQRQQETREPEQQRVVAPEALAVCSGAPQAEVTAQSPLTPCDTSGLAAAPGGEPDICGLRESSGRPGAPAEKPPPTPERTSPDVQTNASLAVRLQAPPQSPGSSPKAPSQAGDPEQGAAPGVRGASVLLQEGGAGPWGVSVPRTSRWQVDVSRLSGARRALREAPSGSADSTQSLSDAMPCSPREASSEVTSPSLEDREQPVCLPGLPACPAHPSACNGSLCDTAVAALESGPADQSLEALLQAAVRTREESASRAAAALAAAAHLDNVLHAARVYTSMQDLSAGGPPQAALQALLTLREEGHGWGNGIVQAPLTEVRWVTVCFEFPLQNSEDVVELLRASAS